MNLSVYGIPGNINIENTDECKISSCIYHFQSSYLDTYCLIRIFNFSSKTIVIASQIWGTTGNNSLLLEDIIEDFNLDHDNLYWINHVGLFSDYAPEEEFSRIMFAYEKDSVFSQKKLRITDEIDISIKSVENLIESSLNPVESWLGLDSIAKNKFRWKRQEKTFRLLHLYIQENIAALCKQEDILEILSHTQSGAIFFYPNQDKKFEFIKYVDILNNNNDSIKKVLPYIDKSFPDEEIVVCICIDNINCDPFCTILKKKSFIHTNNISFVSLENLLECDIRASETVQLDIAQYREEIQAEDNKLQKLLSLYLEPKLDYLISELEKEKVILESEVKDLRGAIIYFPEMQYSIFHPKEELAFLTDKLTLNHVDVYNIESEVVICVLSSSEGFCGIFPRQKA